MKLRWLVAIGAAAIVHAVVILQLPDSLHFSTDAGNKAFQVESFARTGVRPFDLEYPARDVDPDLRWHPRGGHHFLVRDGRVASFYPPYFSLAALPLYKLAGPGALRLLPALAALLAMTATAVMVRRWGMEPEWPTAVVGLATPLLFYAVDFWEQSIAALFVTTGLILVAGSARNVLQAAGGLAFAFGCVLREECYVALAATLIVMVVSRRSIRPALVVTGGAMPVLLPLWMHQYLAWGHPLGVHAAIYASFTDDAGPWSRIRESFGNLEAYLFEFHPESWANALAAVPIALLVVLALKERADSALADRIRIVLLATWCVAATLLAIVMMSNPEPLTGTLYRQGLLPGVPILALLFVRGANRPGREESITVLSALLAAGLITLLLNRRDFGIIWGPRHFVPVLIPLVAGAFSAWSILRQRTSGPWRVAATAAGLWLILVSAAIQSFGIKLLFDTTRHSERVVAAISAGDNVHVVTDVFWLGEALVPLHREHQLLYVTSDGEMAALEERFRERGVGSYTFVATRAHRQLSNDAMEGLLSRAGTRVRVSKGSDPLMDVMVIPVRP